MADRLGELAALSVGFEGGVMIRFCVTVTYELEQMRTVFEDIGTQVPARI